MSREPGGAVAPRAVSSNGTLVRVTLIALASGAVVVGVWASIAPSSFYDDFVFGRAWVALDGPYNVHLVRDVGGLNLALAVVTIAAAIRLDAWTIRVAAIATLVYAVPHLAYHAGATEPFGAIDIVAQLVSLGLQVIAPAFLLWWTGGRGASSRAATSAPSATSAGSR